MNKKILTLCGTLLLLFACGNKKEAETTDDAEKPTANYLQRQRGDSTLYGLACDGTTDSILVLLPYTGADPDTFDIINASQQKKIYGKPFIGDELAVTLNPEDKMEVLQIVNLDDLKGQWAFMVKPKLRDYEKMSRRLRRRMMAEMPDSVKEAMLVPREYVIQLKRGNSASTKGMKRVQTTDEMSPVEYPEIKHYSEWHIFNGRLILASGTNDIPMGDKKKQKIERDTASIVQLTKDTLVLRFDDGDWGFYRKSDK